MPKITNPKVIDSLLNPYFDQHTAMHLARERLTLPDGSKLPLILPPCVCDNCRDGEKGDAAAMPAAAQGAAEPAAAAPGMPGMAGAGGMPAMTEAGQPGSGRQLLEMHHEMIRVFRFLLENSKLKFLADWPTDPKDPRGWRRTSAPDEGCYAPELWDLDDPTKLPHEIIGMLKVTDPEYLGLVFAGVKRLIKPNEKKVDEAVDSLGRFIEQGVKAGKPDGSGFHETIHEYLAAREGMAARGAEMNKLRNSRFNDYFWSLHLWIDAQYGRLLEKRGEKFDTSPLDPEKTSMCTGNATGGQMPGMEPAAA